MVISISRLIDGMDGDRVTFDEHGERVEVDLPASVGPAVLLVTSVTDAVKRVDGGLVRSLDRDELWAVEAIALDRVVLSRLGNQELSVDNLLRIVDDLGYSWQVSPISVP